MKTNFFGIERKENETDWEFCFRCVRAKINKDIDVDYQDIIDYFNLGIARDSLRKAVNVSDFSAIKVAEYYENKIENMNCVERDSSIDELLLELENKKLEIIKERTKLQDQRRNYHSLVRTEARWESLFDMLKEEISKLPTLEHNNHAHHFVKTKTEASLILSDWHIGSLINTYHNKFDIEIAKDRVNKLKEYTIKHCKLNNVKKLNVEMLGDLVSGVIHITTRLNNCENAVSQVMICSELLANLINDLSNEIQLIDIHYSIGNHGRISANVKESIDSENFEYIIYEFLKLRLANNNNVTFNETKHDKEVVVYNVLGKNIACAHGHRDKKTFDSTLTLSNFLGIHIDEVHFGHFHNFSCKNNVIVNGCLSGADEYSNNMRFNNKPSQTLVVYYEDGSKCLHEIDLSIV